MPALRGPESPEGVKTTPTQLGKLGERLSPAKPIPRQFVVHSMARILGRAEERGIADPRMLAEVTIEFGACDALDRCDISKPSLSVAAGQLIAPFGHASANLRSMPAAPSAAITWSFVRRTSDALRLQIALIRPRVASEDQHGMKPPLRICRGRHGQQCIDRGDSLLAFERPGLNLGLYALEFLGIWHKNLRRTGRLRSASRARENVA